MRIAALRDRSDRPTDDMNYQKWQSHFWKQIWRLEFHSLGIIFSVPEWMAVDREAGNATQPFTMKAAVYIILT